MTSDMTDAPCCIVPKYLAAFRCIAGSCEEDCCHDWRINIDQNTFKKIKTAMSHSKTDRERFRQFLKRNSSDDKDTTNYASITCRPDGGCPFLDDGKLCEIHRRFGPSHLSLVCRSYPRKKSLVGKRTEVIAFLSCPEVARRCLLAPDAMELVELEPGRLDSDAICTQIKSGPGESPYHAYLDEVRQSLLNLVALNQFPLASRLFFVACFADSVSPAFSNGSSEFPPGILAENIESFSDPFTLRELHAQFEQIDSRIDFAMLLVQRILTARLPSISDNFRALLDQTWKNYNLLAESNAPCPADDPKRNPEIFTTIQQHYQRRRSLLQETFTQRIDQYFANYSLNYWFGEWYTSSPDLLVHTTKLFIRLAILRFLLFSHPELNPLVEQLAAGKIGRKERESAQEALDRAAVETFYRFSRGVEHDPVYLDDIQQTLAMENMEPLTKLTLLLKF